MGGPAHGIILSILFNLLLFCITKMIIMIITSTLQGCKSDKRGRGV